jgi:hypothetical protein
MTAQELQTACEFEDALHVGSPVLVRWTSGGRRYRSLGTVAKINQQTYKVRLNEAVKTDVGEAYPAGHQVVVPTINNIAAWTTSNRVEPEAGY